MVERKTIGCAKRRRSNKKVHCEECTPSIQCDQHEQKFAMLQPLIPRVEPCAKETILMIAPATQNNEQCFDVIGCLNMPLHFFTKPKLRFASATNFFTTFKKFQPWNETLIEKIRLRMHFLQMVDCTLNGWEQLPGSEYLTIYIFYQDLAPVHLPTPFWKLGPSLNASTRLSSPPSS